MSNRENIYANSGEQFVKTVLIYGDADDGHAFYDKTKKVKIPKSELFELFMKGVTAVVSDQYYKAVSYKDNGADANIILAGDGADIVLYSAEHGE